MDWPAYSPDLNPIEHLWDALGRRIAACLHHPENTQQLKQMLIEEWALLPQEMLHQLVLSMRRRCEATIAGILASDTTFDFLFLHVPESGQFGHIVHHSQLPSGLIPNALDKRSTDFLSFHLTRQAFPSSRLRKTDEPLSISVSLGKLPVASSVWLIITVPVKYMFLLTR
ncbi:transposable element Tcb2 transposase [Trichonephila clavipes]|nr:transposable element Tcb2 transposase [Trichonephila clavipes]